MRSLRELGGPPGPRSRSSPRSLQYVVPALCCGFQLQEWWSAIGVDGAFAEGVSGVARRNCLRPPQWYGTMEVPNTINYPFLE